VKKHLSLFFFNNRLCSVDSFLRGLLEAHGQIDVVVACCFTAVLKERRHIIAILKPEI
jgi:hypothetical protein